MGNLLGEPSPRRQAGNFVRAYSDSKVYFINNMYRVRQFIWQRIFEQQSILNEWFVFEIGLRYKNHTIHQSYILFLIDPFFLKLALKIIQLGQIQLFYKSRFVKQNSSIIIFWIIFLILVNLNLTQYKNFIIIMLISNSSQNRHISLEWINIFFEIMSKLFLLFPRCWSVWSVISN